MSAFQVFMDHWMIEENKAKKALQFKKRAAKIKVSNHIRLYVLRFWKHYDEWTDDEYQMPQKLRNYGFFLGKSSAVQGECPYCSRSVQRFGLFKQNGDTFLTISCQDKECQAMSMILNISE